MAETQPHSKYRYITPSAQSTRQLLDSTAPAAPTNPEELAFRPQNLARKSSNYAEADARARAALADAHAQGNKREPADGERGDGAGAGAGAGAGTGDADASTSPSTSWRPTYGRKQSWSEQDLKRLLHMSTVIKDDVGGREPGFTQATKENQA